MVVLTRRMTRAAVNQSATSPANRQNASQGVRTERAMLVNVAASTSSLPQPSFWGLNGLSSTNRYNEEKLDTSRVDRSLELPTNKEQMLREQVSRKTRYMLSDIMYSYFKLFNREPKVAGQTTGNMLKRQAPRISAEDLKFKIVMAKSTKQKGRRFFDTFKPKQRKFVAHSNLELSCFVCDSTEHEMCPIHLHGKPTNTSCCNCGTAGHTRFECEKPNMTAVHDVVGTPEKLVRVLRRCDFKDIFIQHGRSAPRILSFRMYTEADQGLFLKVTDHVWTEASLPCNAFSSIANQEVGHHSLDGMAHV
eukprot:CAMPEP_0184698886 /NCGR_PEP_ID=MMETSP0313-20130426/5339_1 /TAXON_ID=2792 /ORGANISM="Porphyridium aerugineum, Strain SAG 1380-2" /LENGTH=305 /DNA_ID=CAMNT_0027157883 /DNA_START=48 /DNA_END=965 /DNA_ORIENTATION=-